MVGKWLRVNRSCSCLAVLSSTAWDLLTIFTKLFNSSVHTHTHGPRGHLNTGCLEVHLFSNLPGNPSIWELACFFWANGLFLVSHTKLLYKNGHDQLTKRKFTTTSTHSLKSIMMKSTLLWWQMIHFRKKFIRQWVRKTAFWNLPPTSPTQFILHSHLSMYPKVIYTKTNLRHFLLNMGNKSLIWPVMPGPSDTL